MLACFYICANDSVQLAVFGRKPGAYAQSFMPLGFRSVTVCIALVFVSALQDLFILSTMRRYRVDFAQMLPGFVGDGSVARICRNALCFSANYFLWHVPIEMSWLLESNV